MVPVVAAAALLGCRSDGADDAGSDVVRRDSAGVEIVESAAPAWTDGTRWRVAAEPRVAIGSVDGPEAEQMFRVSDATVLSDGRIAVANSGTSEIRFYGPDGAYLSRVGGDGEGPGEYRRLGSIHRLPGDSLLAWDERLRRLTVFAAAPGAGAGVSRTFRLEPPAERTLPRFEDRFEDGSLLVSVPRIVSEPPEDFEVVGSELLYMRYTAAGAPIDTVGGFPTGMSIIRTHADGGFTFWRVPFVPPSRLVPGGGAVHATRGDEIVRRSNTAGWSPDRIIRRAFDPVPVDDALMRRAFEEERDAVGTGDDDYVGLMREAFEAMPRPDHVAAFDRIALDPAGYAWARRTPLPGEAPARWSVFAPDGRWLGDLELPAGLEVYEVGDDYVLGRETDELEVERVVLYRIERG